MYNFLSQERTNSENNCSITLFVRGIELCNVQCHTMCVVIANEIKTEPNYGMGTSHRIELQLKTRHKRSL